VGLREELAYEQTFADSVYRRIDRLRDEAAGLAAEVIGLGRGGLASNRVDRDARVVLSLRRAESLSIGEMPVCFGRLDMDGGESWHVGRLGVSDEDGEVLLMDWRAPLAEAFYRATSQDRHGVVLRRHIRMKGRQVTGLDDELLVGPQQSDRSRLVGEGALLAALTSPRTGHMTDIVATIQADQDTAIRAPMHGPMVIDGGPGTGKTAVALHRAAYLLYEHRFPLADQGVLVVGPNPTFCQYVEQVLPGLGETGVRLASPGELIFGRAADVVDAPEVAAIKASKEMADHLAETTRSHQRPLDATVYVGAGIHRLAVTVGDSQKMIDTARRAGAHNRGRAVLERLVLRYLLRRAERADQRALRTRFVTTTQGLPSPESTLDTLRRSAQVRELIDGLWPKLSAEQLVDETLARLGIPRFDHGLSEHDLGLLDEAQALLGPAPTRRRRSGRKDKQTGGDDNLDRTLSDMGITPNCPSCGREVALLSGRWNCQMCQRQWRLSRLVSPEQVQQIHEIIDRIRDTHSQPSQRRPLDTFGHVIVDEAQDLSPMQWRMLARRCPTGSFTIVGDLGQTKHPWAPEDWADVCSEAAPEHPCRVEKLGVNYRTPSEVMALAASVLAHHRPDLAPPIAVRSGGIPPRVATVGRGQDVVSAVQALASQEAATVNPGTVGIIRSEAPAEPRRPARQTRQTWAEPLDQPIVELAITEAKGLEFDSVVIVEPADFSPGELYVAITRTTSRLTLVHQRPLPAVIPEDLCIHEKLP
jgi:DNA helicase IV